MSILNEFIYVHHTVPMMGYHLGAWAKLQPLQEQRVLSTTEPTLSPNIWNLNLFLVDHQYDPFSHIFLIFALTQILLNVTNTYI